MSRTTTIFSGALAAAHRGYAYQDLLTAYLLLQGLVTGFDEIIIDKKLVNDDRFDDVETRVAGRRLRRQVKSSQQSDRCLMFDDFNGARSSLRFDRLVRTFVSESLNQAEEYRLCATWGAPGRDDRLAKLMAPFDGHRTFNGSSTTLMKLDASQLWTEAGDIIFSNAQQAFTAVDDISREDVLRFCQHFVIEVGLPQASLDLNSPGQLERLVLDVLEDGVGIGRYPNDSRRIEDVAALAIYVAMTSRTTGETLTKAALIQRLDIRTDFGRVAQAFPFDRAVMQERASVRQHLMAEVARGGIHLLLAGPGSGKSWVLTQLAEDLIARGVVVARHYCFLEPGDELMERRVTTDVFIGNLMGELSDALQRNSVEYEGAYASGLDEFESMLKHAVQSDTRVVIIVDGMDHIARVVASSHSLSGTETDIVERLATLHLPDNVTLVIGSQPGRHLDAIRNTREHEVVEHSLAAWSSQEIKGLAVALGVSDALGDVGLDEEEQRQNVFETLAERSEGNPLYTRYLSLALVRELHSAKIVSPTEWLESAPVIEGDIFRYYQHLYDSASKEAQAIADVLGVLDFAVTITEVQTIVGPLLEDRVEEALATLSPVLSHAAAQGGVRVFHESFRHFMMAAIERRGTSLAKILKPVALWLESQEFFMNAKSYRFMLPLLRRSGREMEILTKVSKDFVNLSVLHGHPQDAIERNLTLAADVAARNLDWPALIRIAELSRATEACFSDGDNDWDEYWQTFLLIFGSQATSDRLLFDGKPTLNRSEGLSICAMVDAAGASAPWREYFALTFIDESDSRASGFDFLEPLSKTEENYLAAIRGRLRLGHNYRIFRASLINFSNAEGKVTSAFIRKVAQLLAEFGHAEIVRQFVKRATSVYLGNFIMPQWVGCALLLGLADASRVEPELCGPVRPYANQALAFATSPDEVLWCLDAGASLQNALNTTVKKCELDVFLSLSSSRAETSSLRHWVSTVRLLARTEQGRNELSDTMQLVQGDGWYLCWIRFVFDIAIAEGRVAEGLPVDVLGAFNELTVDTRPFSGTPRACDLYFIHGLINDSLKRAFSLLRSTEEWHKAISCVDEARSKTATHLDREDGGPITAGAFMSILLSFATNADATEVIAEALEKKLADEEVSGTYYSTHAEFRMRLARLHAKVGKKRIAEQHWNKAAQFLTSYTFHKDIALFDLIDSAAALKGGNDKIALNALARLQPLLSAVLRHTDRRETRNAPNAWFRALLEVDRICAVKTLSRTIAVDVGGPSWMALDALQAVLKEVGSSAEPLIADALWETLLFDIEYEGHGEKLVSERLVPLERLAQARYVHLEDRFRYFSGQVQNETRGHAAETTAPLQDFAERHGLHFQYSSSALHAESKGRREETRVLRDKGLALEMRPAFPISSALVEIIATIRRIAKEQVGEEDMYGLLTLPLSYALSEMVDRGDEAQAQRVLYFLVHEAKGWNYSTPHPIGQLAQCLDEAGHTRLAAVAYVLKYTTARGGWGWLSFGGSESTPALLRALELDRSNALSVLANETARKLRTGGFNGLTKHLVQQIAFWGDVEIAAAAWEEAFQVMEMRLSLTGNAWYFEPLDLNDDAQWSLDEGLVMLLLVRSTDPSTPRRIAALAGVARLLEFNADILTRPARWFLSSCTTVASVQALLQLLLESPTNLSDIICSNEDILRVYTRSDSWSLSTLAIALLGKMDISVDFKRAAYFEFDEHASHRGHVLARFGDVSALLPRLAEIWPALPGIVAKQMQLLDNESFNALVRERLELEYDRGGNSRPPAEVLSWLSEMVIAVLDKALCSLPAHLWRTGQWYPGFDSELLWRLLPEQATRIALHASMGPRPNYPLPTSAGRAIGPLIEVAENDSAYGGWTRLAMRELHYFRSDNKTWGTPDREAELSAGIVCTSLDGTVPASAGPFGSSSMWPWWWEIDEDDAEQDAALPQLVKVFRVKDWLGQCITLVPPLALRHHAKLNASSFGAPLRWTDKEGKPAVVLRTWRLRGKGHQIESYSTQGCELLLRPDLVDVLYSTFGGPLKELYQIRLKEVPEDSN